MNWLHWCLLSAFFAGLTAILAKIGIAGVDSWRIISNKPTTAYQMSDTSCADALKSNSARLRQHYVDAFDKAGIPNAIPLCS